MAQPSKTFKRFISFDRHGFYQHPLNEHRTAKVLRKQTPAKSTAASLGSSQLHFRVIFFRYSTGPGITQKKQPPHWNSWQVMPKPPCVRSQKDGVSSSHGSIPTRGGVHSMMFFLTPPHPPSPPQKKRHLRALYSSCCIL